MIMKEKSSNSMKFPPLSRISRGFPNRDGLPKPVPIVYSIDDRCVVNTERVGDTHSSQTVDANARLSVDVKNFFLTVDLIGTVASRTVVIDEETVQTRSEDEDIAGLGNMQAPRSLLSAGEGWISPPRKGSVERTRRWGAGLEIR